MKYELLWPLIQKINETHCTYKNLDAVMELRMSLINHIAHMDTFDYYAPAWGLYPED